MLFRSFNDNLFKQLVLLLCVDHFVKEGKHLQGIAMILFAAPFILFSGYAGFLSDRFSKRTSILWLKAVEVILVALGAWAIQASSVPLMFLILFLIGVQAALIGTAKLGIIPEIVRRSDISAANGWSGLATLAGVIIGTVAGYGLADRIQAERTTGLWAATIALVGTALAGLLGSVMTGRVSAASPQLRFQWNLVSDSWRDIRLIISDRAILRVTLGIVFFWCLAAMAQMSIDVFVRMELADNLVKIGRAHV